MSGFHKPKMYRSVGGCCICRAKSSSSRFTDSNRYARDFSGCFGTSQDGGAAVRDVSLPLPAAGLGTMQGRGVLLPEPGLTLAAYLLLHDWSLAEVRCGEICNACVLLVKRWKKLPAGSKKNWNHVVDAKGGSSLKTNIKMKKSRVRVQKGLTRSNSDAHSSTSSASPAQSLTYSYQSDEGSECELPSGMDHSPAFSFLDLTYWKRQKVCCGIIYKGRYGEVIIDPHLYKPCCQRKSQQGQEEMGEEDRQANGGTPKSPPLLSGSESPQVIPEDIQQQERAGDMEAQEEKPSRGERC